MLRSLVGSEMCIRDRICRCLCAFVGRASVGLHTEMYFANNPTEEDAFVLSVEKTKLSVIVPRFGIEGTVREERAIVEGCQRRCTRSPAVANLQGTFLNAVFESWTLNDGLVVVSKLQTPWYRTTWQPRRMPSMCMKHRICCSWSPAFFCWCKCNVVP